MYVRGSKRRYRVLGDTAVPRVSLVWLRSGAVCSFVPPGRGGSAVFCSVPPFSGSVPGVPVAFLCSRGLAPPHFAVLVVSWGGDSPEEEHAFRFDRGLFGVRHTPRDTFGGFPSVLEDW